MSRPDIRPDFMARKAWRARLTNWAPQAALEPLTLSGAQGYGAARTIALEPYLLALAALLLCGDALVSLWLRGYFPQRMLGRRRLAGAVLRRRPACPRR